jgi:protein Mpv17
MLRISSGVALPKIGTEIKETVFPLIRDGFKLWFPAHMITYGVIPIENRLLWVDMVEILWVVILSSTAAASKKKADSADVASGISSSSPSDA